VDFTGPVRRDHDDGRLGRADRSKLGNRDLEVGQQLEQVSLELLVGAIDFVDQQDRRPFSRLLDGAEQRPLDQKGIGEQLTLGRSWIQRVRAFEQSNLEDLPRVVPLVDGVADVEALVALQADQLGVERGREDFRHFGLADPGLAFEEQRPLQAQREIGRDGEPSPGDVLLAGHGLLQLVDRCRYREFHRLTLPSA
jgi:hypothetical protein